jgi:signal recognition particle GTPase
METALAIYEALIQANVSPPAARRVAESLEKDMTSNLATKQDLQGVKQELQHFEQLMTTRFDSLESRVTLMLQNQESRIVVKLGVLMTVLFGMAGTALAVLR